MTVFLSGGAKNGKSTLAQNLALSLSGGGPHYYVATMLSTGREDDARIARHIADRFGLGFETVECFRNLTDILQTVSPEGTFLVDSVTALVQNALFPPEKQYAIDIPAAEKCVDEMIRFAHRVKNAVFVSDYIYADGMPYSEETKRYCRLLAQADRRLAQVCDTVVEVSAGQYTVYKGKL